MKTKLFDITEQEIEKNSVWYFPMLEDDDELTICAADSFMNDNHLKILATSFYTRTGSRYIGYVYHDEEESIKDLKPVIIYGGINLNFWKGIRVPTRKVFDEINSVFGVDIFPIKFETLPNNLNLSHRGEIHGIYFFNEEKKVSCLKP